MQGDTSYEIRICSIYNNIIGPWSGVEKIKTLYYDFNCDSIILNESKRKDEFLEKIYDWCGCKRMELIYRGCRDGSLPENFHEKYDNQGPTVCLIKNEKGFIFGGFSSISWTIEKDNGWTTSSDNFIFTLTNIYSTPPSKFPISQKIYSIRIEDYKKTDSFTQFPSSYTDSLGYGKSIFTGDNDNKKQDFKIKKVEVFKIIK